MRILLVTDWPLRWAGTERYVLELRDGLEAAGHEVRLMTSSIGSEANGTAAYVGRTTDRRRAQALLQVANPSALATIARALREFDPDVVHLAMFLPYLSPAVLAPLRSRATTVMVTDFKPVCPVGTKLLPDGNQCRAPMGTVCHREGCLSFPRAARELARYGAFRAGLSNVDRVFGCSRHVTGELERVGIGAVHKPLPVAAPEPSFRRRPAADPHLVYAGRLATVKGVDLLLEAFAELLSEHPKARLTVCGDGLARESLIGMAGRLGLGSAVEFVLGMPRDWTLRLQDAWALVAPSLYREPLGIVAIEAIVRDVPVIAAGDGGFAESVEEGRSGLLFPNGNRGELLERMRAVCERRAFPDQRPDPDSRGRLARRHDLGDHVRDMERAWEEIGA
jgi:glycosyltransferase involved in cell wall biosynthesis